MVKIADMERRVYKEIDHIFKTLRDKFTRYNPFKEAKMQIRERMEDCVKNAHNLDSQGYLALSTLKDYLAKETAFKEEGKRFLMEVNHKIENAKNLDPIGDKEFNRVHNGFDAYIKIFKDICERWLKIIVDS
eukprot:CAMPEP_0114593490 /NCGR_PEP_ID=MMETSP0125-20121206/15082_1 /TAXON_ID=485358 ORGANISM="Aristerostoma sp., Strain ATCC 50986" /NCGR_SAMPLE_ID=MMETSP0125 /ASSEMBLY_ACC=CAM_ASM_000245 /LENGTH=131 /DNA_ID=CAMNT_0001792717 /DNA_START=454 /DNA_END=849 /DNA_ORIENTATION=+